METAADNGTPGAVAPPARKRGGKAAQRGRSTEQGRRLAVGTCITMFPEDGCLWVYVVGENDVPAFTTEGIENLKTIIVDLRTVGEAPPPIKRSR